MHLKKKKRYDQFLYVPFSRKRKKATELSMPVNKIPHETCISVIHGEFERGSVLFAYNESQMIRIH